MGSTPTAATGSSAPQRAEKLMPLFVGYLLLLAQFIFMCLFIMGFAFDASSTTQIVTGVCWGVLLVLSLIAMTHQATVNRHNEKNGNYPSPYLLVPTERPERIAAYDRIYRASTVEAPASAPTQSERVAA